MSSSLEWKPARTKGYDLPDELKYILQKIGEFEMSRKTYKVEEILSISFLTEKTIIDLKPRSGKLKPVMTPFGMSQEGYGSVCCLTDLSVEELINLRDYIQDQILKRAIKTTSSDEQKEA